MLHIAFSPSVIRCAIPAGGGNSYAQVLVDIHTWQVGAILVVMHHLQIASSLECAIG